MEVVVITEYRENKQQVIAVVATMTQAVALCRNSKINGRQVNIDNCGFEKFSLAE